MAIGISDFPRFGKIRVLLAEDNAVNQLLARFTLETWGAAVDLAHNGRDAIALHEKNTYDLILMDIQMPEMDGLEATKRIRQSPNLLKCRIPIIALTANARPGDRDLYLAAGMNDCLSKPYTEAQLYAILNRCLAGPARQTAPLPGPAGARGAALYDLAHIQSLSRGNAASLQRTLHLIQQHLPRQLGELQISLQQGQWVRLAETAHNLKTSIDLMGIRSLHHDIRFIETQARQQEQIAALPEAVVRVVQTLEEVLEQLRELSGEES